MNTWYIHCNSWIWDIHHYLKSSVLADWLCTALILTWMHTLHSSFRIFYLFTCALDKSLLFLQGHQLRKCPSSYMLSLPIYSYHLRIPCKIKCFLFLPLTHYFLCFLLRKCVFSSAQFVSGTKSDLFHTKQFWSRSLKNLHLLNPLPLVSLRYSVWRPDNPYLLKTVFNWHSGRPSYSNLTARSIFVSRTCLSCGNPKLPFAQPFSLSKLSLQLTWLDVVILSTCW